MFLDEKGCKTTIKLENLEQHVSVCEYNLNASVVCDKGCNLPITRQQYQENNCFSHLANEVKTLRHEFSNELRFILLSDPPQWQVIQNMITNIHKLQVGSQGGGLSYAQSAHALTTTNSAFKIYYSNSTVEECVKTNFYVGLTLEGCFRESMFAFKKTNKQWIKELQNGADKDKHFLRCLKCRIGDVIECRIAFPQAFNVITSDGNSISPVCLYVNQKLIFKKVLKIPTNGFFPTIILTGNSVVRYYQKLN